jgi:hypothetical protein
MAGISDDAAASCGACDTVETTFSTLAEGQLELARLAVRPVRAAVGAELLQLDAVGIVPTVLLGDVVAVLANLAGQGDLGPHIGGGGHWTPTFG